MLDPFAGVGTTLIEADIAGHTAVGFEINPYAVFAARAKLGAHRLEPARLSASIADFVAFMGECEHSGRAPQASPPAAFRTRAPFYSPAVERKVLLAFDFIRHAGCAHRRAVPPRLRGDHGELLQLLL